MTVLYHKGYRVTPKGDKSRKKRLSTTKIGTQLNRKERKTQQKLLAEICTRCQSGHLTDDNASNVAHCKARETEYH